MTEEFIIGLARASLEIMLMASLPVLLVILVVGVAISIVQSVTQIQETTISFVPKIVVTFVSLLLFGPWMLEKLTGFTRDLLQGIPHWIR